MKKHLIFRDMFDYMAHIADVTDADMNYCGDTIRIVCETEGQTFIIDVTIRNKEVKENA